MFVAAQNSSEITEDVQFAFVAVDMFLTGRKQVFLGHLSHFDAKQDHFDQSQGSVAGLGIEVDVLLEKLRRISRNPDR